MDICAEAGVPFEVAYPPKAGTAAIAPAEDPAPPAANDKEAQP